MNVLFVHQNFPGQYPHLAQHLAAVSGNRVVAYCKKGALLGEMSYVTGETANATVRAAEKMRFVQWDHADLKRLSEKNELLMQGFQTAMNENLIRKLKLHRERSAEAPGGV